jgi:hypothetical protein
MPRTAFDSVDTACFTTGLNLMPVNACSVVAHVSPSMPVTESFVARDSMVRTSCSLSRGFSSIALRWKKPSSTSDDVTTEILARDSTPMTPTIASRS